jgi:hypothetical protein
MSGEVTAFSCAKLSAKSRLSKRREKNLLLIREVESRI